MTNKRDRVWEMYQGGATVNTIAFCLDREPLYIQDYLHNKHNVPREYAGYIPARFYDDVIFGI